MFSYPFLILQKRATDNIPELREIDFYLEQDSTTDKTAWLMAAPALYFEFIPLGETRVMANKARMTEVEITFHLLTENVMDSGKRMKKDQANDHMRLFDSVNKYFLGFGSLLSYLPEFAALQNTKDDQRMINSLTSTTVVSPHKIRKSMMKSTQTFKTIIWDHSACKKYSKPSPQPTLDLQINANIITADSTLWTADSTEITADQT